MWVSLTDIFHYIIGMLIVYGLIMIIVKLHEYFSVNNLSIEQLTNKSNAS